MQAKIIYTKRSNITEEHTSDPEQSGLERKLEVRIALSDMPEIPVSLRYGYRGPSKTWVPTSAKITESFTTGYGEDGSAHYRNVDVVGLLVKKDGTVGKLTYDDNWQSYSSAQIFGSLESMPDVLHVALNSVLPAFQKGVLPA